VGAPRDAARDFAIGVQHGALDGTGVGAAVSQRSMQVRNEIAAGAGGHSARAHAVGHDEQRCGAVERAVTVFVDRMAPAARRRDGGVESRAARCEHRLAHEGRVRCAVAARRPRDANDVVGGHWTPFALRAPAQFAPWGGPAMVIGLPSRCALRRNSHLGAARRWSLDYLRAARSGAIRTLGRPGGGHWTTFALRAPVQFAPWGGPAVLMRDSAT